MTTDEKLKAIYNSETNVRIESFYDAGWLFAIGDNSNGYIAINDCDVFKTGVDWLYSRIVEGTSNA